MQNDQKTPSPRRIDLSNCKLLSTYGLDPADSTGSTRIKVGELLKTGLFRLGVVSK